MRVIRFLPPEPLQLFMVKEGLHPEIIVHPKDLELLGQWEVCKDHIMDLNLSGSVFSQSENDPPEKPLVPMGILPQTSWELVW